MGSAGSALALGKGSDGREQARWQGKSFEENTHINKTTCFIIRHGAS